MIPTPQQVLVARNVLTSAGYVVLKEKSYRQAQERQRCADVLRASAEERVDHIQRWAETDLHNDIRDLQARCTFLYGAARAHGATTEELAGGWVVTGANIPMQRTQTLQCYCGTYPYIIYDPTQRPITRFVCPDHGLVNTQRERVSHDGTK